jgi:hypothetical protein
MKMHRQNAPAAALEKLISLSDAAERLSDQLIKVETGIAAARQRLTGNFTRDSEYVDARAALDQMVADLPALQKRLRIAEATYSSCKAFLDDLPDNATLEQVNVDATGHGSLEFVRARIRATQADLKALRAIPTTADDIEERVRAYVEGLGKPQISGLGHGEKLRVLWPGAGFGPSGPREDRADPLALQAFLHPDTMVQRLLRQIERVTAGAMPIKERSARIAKLEDELNELAFVEEALVAAAIANGEDVQRSPNALPQAVLGVRVADAKQRAA